MPGFLLPSRRAAGKRTGGSLDVASGIKVQRGAAHPFPSRRGRGQKKRTKREELRPSHSRRNLSGPATSGATDSNRRRNSHGIHPKIGFLKGRSPLNFIPLPAQGRGQGDGPPRAATSTSRANIEAPLGFPPLVRRDRIEARGVTRD